MILAVVVIVIAVPLHFTGGITHAFSQVAHQRPTLLTVHHGARDQLWWTTSMVASAVGGGLLTFPHFWPGLLSAKNERSLRRNWVFLPAYQIAVILPMTIGFVAVLVLPKKSDANGVLLQLTGMALPGWLTGLIAVAGAAAATVPAAAMVLSMSTLLARNVVRTRNARVEFFTNHVSVVAILGLALVLALVRPNALADLLLLTYSGMIQFAPGLVAGLRTRPLLSRGPVILGIVAGVALVAWLTFGNIDIAHINTGLIGLGANIVVAVVAQLVIATVGRRQPAAAPAAETA